MFGVGPDGIGGTADDVDVDFGEDAFNPNEGFLGTEDTLSRIAFVLRVISPGATSAPPTRCAGGLLAACPIRHVDRLTGLEPVDSAGVDVGLAGHGRRVAELVRRAAPPAGRLACAVAEDGWSSSAASASGTVHVRKSLAETSQPITSLTYSLIITT